MSASGTPVAPGPEGPGASDVARGRPGADAARRSPLRGATRGRAVVASLVLGLAALGTSVATWVTATGSSALSTTVPLTVAGSSAAPGVTSAGLALLAAGVAALLAGRAGRWLVGVVVALASLVVSVGASGVLRDAGATARDEATRRTGVDVLVGVPDISAWPYVALAFGVLGVLAGLWIVAGPSWSRGSSRHERARGASAPGPGPTPATEPEEPDLATLWDEQVHDDVRDDEGHGRRALNVWARPDATRPNIGGSPRARCAAVLRRSDRLGSSGPRSLDPG